MTPSSHKVEPPAIPGRFKDFESLEEARKIIGEFLRRYNEQWMLERFEYRSPLEIRQSFAQVAA